MVSSSGIPSTSGSQWSNISSESLDDILSSKQGLQSLLELDSRDAAIVIDVFDRLLDSPTITPRQQRNYTRAMRKLCGTYGMPPTSHILTGLAVIEDVPYKSGGFANVWRGRFQGRKVAIKALRIYATDDLVEVKKKFYKEALVWKRLSHPNVLPFLGVSTSVFPLCMVSHWMAHGNVVEYVEANPDVNRLVLLSDVAGGLFYLHGICLVHGDLKGGNILINSDYRACLADFGLTTIISDSHTSYSTTTTNHGGTVRWMAPELLLPEEYGFMHSNPSKASDIYAIGMVIYEVMTGTIPFKKYRDSIVIFKVKDGVRPEHPTDAEVLGLADTVWELMEACWNQQWNERPPVSTVLSCLNEASRYWNPPSPTSMTASIEIESHDSDSDASSFIAGDVFETQQNITYSATDDQGSSDAVQPTVAGEHNLERPSIPTTYEEDESSSDEDMYCESPSDLSELLSDSPLSTSTSEIIDQEYLDSAFGSKDGFKGLLKLTDEKAIMVIDLIDTALSSGHLSGDLRRRYIAVLRKLCGNCVTLPETRILVPELVRLGDIPHASGAHTDIWEGQYMEKKVAIKVLRVHVVDGRSSNVKKQFIKEAAVWCHIRHQNILPFIGVADGSDFCLVSPWMIHGDISKYVNNHPQANRLPLLKDALEGLKYLHSENIIHGDLKGANILINDNKRACLADFGLTSIIADKMSGYFTSSLGGGTYRWMAPELLYPEMFDLEKCTSTIESDIFAIGMVICEIITGNVPWYPEVKRNETVIVKIIDGQRPDRPDDATFIFVKPLWPIAEMCWCQAAKERSNLIQVLGCLEEEIRNWQTRDETQTDDIC